MLIVRNPQISIGDYLGPMVTVEELNLNFNKLQCLENVFQGFLASIRSNLRRFLLNSITRNPLPNP